MRKLLKDTRGGALVEYALVALPVLMFTVGIMQTAWIIWANNLLQVSVDAAVRCGAVGSTTTPCAGGTTADMITTANRVFVPLSGASFNADTSTCSSPYGLVGTYEISLAFVVNLTITAKSCYPSLS